MKAKISVIISKECDMAGKTMDQLIQNVEKDYYTFMRSGELEVVGEVLE